MEDIFTVILLSSRQARRLFDIISLIFGRSTLDRRETGGVFLANALIFGYLIFCLRVIIYDSRFIS